MRKIKPKSQVHPKGCYSTDDKSTLTSHCETALCAPLLFRAFLAKRVRRRGACIDYADVKSLPSISNFATTPANGNKTPRLAFSTNSSPFCHYLVCLEFKKPEVLRALEMTHWMTISCATAPTRRRK